MINHNCKGCKTYYLEPICALVPFPECTECPCGLCLIKVICDDPCGDYTVFRHILITKYKEIGILNDV